MMDEHTHSMWVVPQPWILYTQHPGHQHQACICVLYLEMVAVTFMLGRTASCPMHVQICTSINP